MLNKYAFQKSFYIRTNFNTFCTSLTNPDPVHSIETSRSFESFRTSNPNFVYKHHLVLFLNMRLQSFKSAEFLVFADVHCRRFVWSDSDTERRVFLCVNNDKNPLQTCTFRKIVGRHRLFSFIINKRVSLSLL